MNLRVFLSHKRQREKAIFPLRDELRVLGIGGWKDTEDLEVGGATKATIKHVIGSETGGFIWWATRDTLDSKVITKVEIPAALRRRRHDPDYPLVPVFVEVDPMNAGDCGRLARALGPSIIGRSRAKAVLDLNGITRTPAESLKALVPRVADRYASDAIRRVGGKLITASFNVSREPRPGQDLSFDWRPVFDMTEREFRAGGEQRIRNGLRIAREALQSQAGQPEILAAFDTPLPIACLVGYEWRLTSGICLNVLQRTGSTEYVVDGDGDVVRPAEMPALPRDAHSVVIAVSCPWPIETAARHYADALGADLIELHVPRILEPAEIRGLARTVVDLLKRVNDAAAEKHLLIRGPEALAALIGAGANATGVTTVPLWHVDRYVDHVQLS